MKKKIISLIMATVLMVCATAIAPSVTSAASYKDQIAELERKQATLKNQIDDLQDDIDEQEKLRDALQSQIDTLQAQIDIYNDEITSYEDEIDEMKAEQAVIEADLQAKKDLFLQRVRALYISGSGNSSLSILLGADDFSNFLYQDQILESITAHDDEIMKELQKDIDKYETLKAGIQVKIDEVDVMKAGVVSKQSVLNDSVKQYNAVISKLEGEQGELEGTLEEYQEQIDALEEKISDAANDAKNESISSNIKYDGSQFRWPCPNYYYISSPFGPRWGRNHNGIDIAGSAIYGKPIVAAADGQVTLSSYNSGGYGNYVMINHGNSSDGNNYVTLYAHMSSRAAYVGQRVSAGDVIGYVGSTGYSTGPHLHFEIRVNGSPRNPLGWFNN